MVLSGCARKFALLLAGVVALGWLIIITGEIFNLDSDTDGKITLNSPARFNWWMVIIVTPIMLIMAVIHAVVDGRRTSTHFIGSFTTFFSMLFLLGLGVLLTVYGDGVHVLTQSPDGSVGLPLVLMFGGSLIAGLGWMSLACLSHYYDYQDETDSISY